MAQVGNAHRRSRLLRGVGRVVPTCAVLWADRASVQVCAAQTPRPPTMRRKKTRAGIKPALALQIERRCFPLCTLTILYQQRGSHRRLGNAHGARDDLVEASCVSFASVQARKLNHYAASPLLTKPFGFAGSPRRASEKRTVGSLGRLHHAAQPVWTHNVRPAHKPGCRGWG